MRRHSFIGDSYLSYDCTFFFFEKQPLQIRSREKEKKKNTPVIGAARFAPSLRALDSLLILLTLKHCGCEVE